jgi:DNA-binding MarR family transcriptional regulator
MAREIEEHLSAVRQILRQPVEAEFARGNLTAPQRSVMQALFHSGGLSLKELSRRVGLAHSTVSGIVDRLEKRGLATRRPDPADGRARVDRGFLNRSGIICGTRCRALRAIPSRRL